MRHTTLCGGCVSRRNFRTLQRVTRGAEPVVVGTPPLLRMYRNPIMYDMMGEGKGNGGVGKE